MIGIQMGEEPGESYSQGEEIKKLRRQVKRLRKRLLEKQKYESEMLIQTGATPQYIEAIRKKDEAALKED